MKSRKVQIEDEFCRENEFRLNDCKTECLARSDHIFQYLDDGKTEKFMLNDCKTEKFMWLDKRTEKS